MDQLGDRHAVVTVTQSGRSVIAPEQLRFDDVTGERLAPPAQICTPVWWTSDGLYALHVGSFSGWGLRWLYFLSGLLGCAMIATGLVLWTVKRRAKQDKRLKAGQSVAFGFRLVEALNIGTLAGLCTAVAVFFWANRLIPANLAGRAEWEFHCLFIAWGVALLHAAVRLRFAPSLRVWQEQLWIAAAAYGLIPLLNWATTERHLGITVPAGDWVLAGFDLTVLALGLGFAFAANKVRRRQASQPARARG